MSQLSDEVKDGLLPTRLGFVPYVAESSIHHRVT